MKPISHCKGLISHYMKDLTIKRKLIKKMMEIKNCILVLKKLGINNGKVDI